MVLTLNPNLVAIQLCLARQRGVQCSLACPAASLTAAALFCASTSPFSHS